jgi:protocatechuate 3,4-dioxygenase beta subunit
MRPLTLGIVLAAAVLALVVWSARSGERGSVPARPAPVELDSATLPELELVPAPLVTPKPPSTAAARVPAPPPSSATNGPGFTLVGRVVDHQGAPVEGARVAVRRPPHLKNAKKFLRKSGIETESDAQGRFRLEHLGSGPWRIEVTGDDLESLRRAVELGPALGEVTLTVARGNCLALTLAWGDGTVPQETSLTLVPDARGVERVFTGGALKLCGLTPGRVRVEARATNDRRLGFAVAEADVPAAQPLRLLLTGPERLTVRGRVRDERGVPVPGARVVVALEPSAGAALDAQGEVRVSGAVLDVPVLADGSFSIELEPGRQWIGALARGHSLEHREFVLDGPPAPLEFVLTRLARLEGLVLDAAGQPARGAHVEGVGYLASTQVAATGPDGRFSVTAASGARTIFAREGKHAPSEPLELVLRPGEQLTGLVLRLREGCTLRVRVLDDDRLPLEGALVLAGRRSRPTDADGRVEFTALAPERLWLQTWHPLRDETESEFVGLEVEPSPRTPTEFELVFHPRDPVLLNGKLEHGPGRAGRLLFVGEGGGHAGVTLPDGNFFLVLARPGHWRGTVTFAADHARREPAEVRLFELDVPDVGVHALHLEWELLPRASSSEEAALFLHPAR